MTPGISKEANHGSSATDTNKADHKKVDTDTDDLEVPADDLVDVNSSLPIPPDGGYGWVIVFASLVCNIIVDGVCFSFGVFYLEFLDYFKAGAGKTAWVGSLLPGMYLLVGPIVSALANKYGCRPVTIAGSVLAAISFIAATYSPNIDVLILTYGVMGGTSFGLMYLPSIVIVGFYFDKRRALATGIAVCGSGIGTFIFAPLSRYLIATFGWKGGLWIIAGISLNGVICGVLFRPLSNRPVVKKNLKSSKKKETEKPITSEIMKSIMREKTRLRTISTGSLDGTVITKDNMLIRDPEVIKKINLDSNRNKFSVAMQPLLESHPEENEENAEAGRSEGKVTESDQPSKDIVNKNLLLNKSSPAHKSLEGLSNNTSVRGRTYSDCTEVMRRKRKRNENSISSTGSPRDFVQTEVARPMYRKDVLYAGSVTSIPEYRSSQDMGSYVKSVTNIPQGGALRSRCLPFTSVLLEMFDVTLLKSATFSVNCLWNFLAMTGFFTPFVYTTAKAISLGVDVDQASFLISILGISNTVGRLLAGWLSDRPWASALYINLVALIIGGAATCGVPYFDSYALLAIYCAVFGLCIACFVSLRTIILVDLLGLEKLTNSFGILLLISGIASVIGSPLAGFLVDVTGTFSLSYLISGILLAVSGVICVTLPWIARWELKREKRMKSESTAGQYELA